MSQRPPACDEPLAEMRADAMLRALSKLDSLAPSRTLDRTVRGLAREAANGRASRTAAAGRSVRWAFPVAVAAVAVCAVAVHRTASRPAGPRAVDQRLVEPMQPPQSGAGNTQRWLIPAFIQASVPLLSIRSAPLRKRGVEEQAPRAATRSSERSSRRERDWTAHRRLRPPELIDSVDLLRPAPPPPRRPREAAASR